MRYFSGIVILLLFLSCVNHRKVVERTTANDTLKLGEGGGFTGAWEYWSISDSGKVLFTGTDGKEVKKNSISAENARIIFRDCREFFKTIDSSTNIPGNMNRSINYSSGTQIYRANWPVYEKRYKQLDSVYSSWILAIKSTN